MDRLVLGEEAGIRADKFLAEALGVSRTMAESLLANGDILVNGKPVRKRYLLRQGDRIRGEIPEPSVKEMKPEVMDLEVLYEDEDILVLNKPRGIVVHPAPGNYEGTLVHGLLGYNARLSVLNGEYRPGIVHRIDKDTSGLLIVAKNNQAHQSLGEQFKAHSIERKYIALVLGEMEEDSGEIRLPLGRDPKNRIRIAVVRDGKEAVTHYRVLERFQGYTLVECSLETGRTHQIRVHMAWLQHPVAGDPLYGRKTREIPLDGQYLHARSLGVHHPATGAWMVWDSPLPPYFEEKLRELRGA